MFDSELERRVLGNLPPWRTPEVLQQVIAHETAVSGDSHTCYSLAELTVRLATSAAEIGHEVLTEDALWEVLASLRDKGYVTAVPDLSGPGDPPLARPDRWQMTEAGFGALHTFEGVEPPPHDWLRIQSMVNVSEKLVNAGMVPGSNDFNRAGGLTLEGFKAWRATHAADVAPEATPAELDAAEARCHATPLPPPPPAEPVVPEPPPVPALEHASPAAPTQEASNAPA